MRKSIPWQNIIQGKILNEGPFGSEYIVPDLGRVWVGTSDLTSAGSSDPAVESGKELLCNLVTLPTNLPEENIWAIVGFQSAQKQVTRS